MILAHVGCPHTAGGFSAERRPRARPGRRRSRCFSHREWAGVLCDKALQSCAGPFLGVDARPHTLDCERRVCSSTAYCELLRQHALRRMGAKPSHKRLWSFRGGLGCEWTWSKAWATKLLYVPTKCASHRRVRDFKTEAANEGKAPPENFSAPGCPAHSSQQSDFFSESRSFCVQVCRLYASLHPVRGRAQRTRD